jgi:hypothetical protein
MATARCHNFFSGRKDNFPNSYGQRTMGSIENRLRRPANRGAPVHDSARVVEDVLKAALEEIGRSVTKAALRRRREQVRRQQDAIYRPATKLGGLGGNAPHGAPPDHLKPDRCVRIYSPCCESW